MDSPRIAQVALLSQAVPTPLSYTVPQNFAAQIQLGCVVVVPLQHKWVSGVVVGLGSADEPTTGIHLKPIHALLHAQPALNPQQLALAHWVAQEYVAPLGRCCALMVPPGFTPKSQYVYSLTDEKTAPATLVNHPAASARTRILSLLQTRGALTETKLKTLLRGTQNLSAPPANQFRLELKKLIEEGVVQRDSTLQPPKALPRKTTLAQLVISNETLDIVLKNLREDAIKKPRSKNANERRAAVLHYVYARNGLAWADWIFAETGANRNDLAWLAEQNYILLGDAERWRDPLADIDYITKTPPPLTTDQQQAWDSIQPSLAYPNESQAQFLLRGVTGSGKTEIYMRAVEATLQRGKGAIILVPEISLTPQTARRFLERFPGKVALIHSKLKPGERFDTWRRIQTGELSLVVGARSALFAPVPNIGLIVLDEEHDPSYKQTSTPYYDTRRVAIRYAQQLGATLIFGSATPSLEAMHATLSPFALPHFQFLELPNRVRGHVNRIGDQQARLGVSSVAVAETPTVAYQPLPNIQLIDMRAELRGGNTDMFSGALRLALAETLQRGEQAILFLNRRGTASMVMCRDCGHAMRCPNDDMPLTLHQALGSEKRTATHNLPTLLRCHQCNHAEPVPHTCPVCRGGRIRFLGIGTQKIEQRVNELFPRARVVRWDKDTAASADNLLQRFTNRQADVLVGTQMIAKGLDLPMVTLVGVVLADVGLYLPDFRASERVFNLIEQVAGRAGRGLLAGRVVVQTYNPEAPAISYASKHNVKGFVKQELSQRNMLRLPPFTRLVRFEVLQPNDDDARKQCQLIANQLYKRVPERSDVIGPAPAYFAKRNKQFRWQLLVRTTHPKEILHGLELPRGVVVDVDPISVL